MLSKSYYIYIMTNDSDTLYTGVTNDLTKRGKSEMDGLER
jgi:predicted GIY-YIG superfamily endonuclease